MLARSLVINTNVLDSAALKPGASNDISICTKPTRLYVLAPILVEDANVLSRPELDTREVQGWPADWRASPAAGPLDLPLSRAPHTF